MVVDVIPGLVILKTSSLEQNPQAVTAGGILRIAFYGVHHIKGQRGQFTVVVNAVVNAVVNVDRAHMPEDANAQPIILAQHCQRRIQRGKGGRVGALRSAAGAGIIGNLCGLSLPILIFPHAK